MQRRPSIGFHFRIKDANVTAGPYIVVKNYLTPLISAKGSVLIDRLKSVSRVMPPHNVAHPLLFLSSYLFRFRSDTVVVAF